jgi:tRNA G18 (ribose-2'-O)-methylase SpoU
VSNIIPIASLDDERVAVYRNLKDRELTRLHGLFIAEGELLVRRLLESDFAVHSVLLADRKLDAIAPLVPAGIPVYVAPREQVDKIVGFQFHNGVMACGYRKPALTLDDLAIWRGEGILPSRPAGVSPAESDGNDKPAGRMPAPPLTLVVLPEITKTDNLGALLRISAAFGVSAVILGERCCDPFYRESVRVSMGAAFRLPLVQSEDLAADLVRLRDVHGVTLCATVLDEQASPLATLRRPDRLAILLGNETTGLSPAYVDLCGIKATLPMQMGTDSLNVAVAAAVFLYHFTHVVTPQ